MKCTRRVARSLPQRHSGRQPAVPEGQHEVAGFVEHAIAAFNRNVELYPESANVYDSAVAERILAKNATEPTAALSYFAATIYGVWGEFDRAFAELEKVRENRFGVLASAAVIQRSMVCAMIHAGNPSCAV